MVRKVVFKQGINEIKLVDDLIDALKSRGRIKGEVAIEDKANSCEVYDFESGEQLLFSVRFGLRRYKDTRAKDNLYTEFEIYDGEIRVPAEVISAIKKTYR